MASEMAMLNVRMDRDIKERGNELLAEMGISASQLIRAMWEKLAGDRSQAEALTQSVMARANTSEQQDETKRKLAALQRAHASWDAYVSLVGLDPATHRPLNEDDVEAARYEHLLEKYGR